MVFSIILIGNIYNAVLYNKIRNVELLWAVQILNYSILILRRPL